MEKITIPFEQWMKLDTNEQTRNELKSLMERNEWKELEERLCSYISFGTAGLRASMGAGFSRMNHITVMQASQGLCSYLLCNFTNEESRKGIIIGYDHRHHSKEYAYIVASVFIHRNIPVHLFSRMVPTPLLAFGVKYLECICGVMITASHNPKQDNGYKVYWKGGAQITCPHDDGISKQIHLNKELWFQFDQIQKIMKSSNIDDPYEEIIDIYYSDKVFDPVNQNFDIVYTPMHGVGNDFVKIAFEKMGISFVPVPNQMNPDPDFPTVSFPNPEEPGAFDEAISVAKNSDINPNFIFSNDPDADRFGVAERQGDSWRIFTGDEIGIILGYYLIMKNMNEKRPLGVITTIVSSNLLPHIVKQLDRIHPMKSEITLTGFKYLANKALELEEKGTKVVFAYEEALGYMIGTDCALDKDGIRTLAVMSKIVMEIDCSLGQYLENIYKEFGHVFCINSYFITNGKEQLVQVFTRLRSIVRGSTILDSTIACLNDFFPSKMIVFHFNDNIKIIFRASGTEPKFKFYAQYGPYPIQEKVERSKYLEKLLKYIILNWIDPKGLGLQCSERVIQLLMN